MYLPILKEKPLKNTMIVFPVTLSLFSLPLSLKASKRWWETHTIRRGCGIHSGGKKAIIQINTSEFVYLK